MQNECMLCKAVYRGSCLLFTSCVSKHHDDMCQTEMWVPYHAFHILLFFKTVYVHFHLCDLPQMLPHASSYGLHMLCLLGTHKKFHEVNI